MLSSDNLNGCFFRIACHMFLWLDYQPSIIVNTNGLTAAVAAELLAELGPNVLTPPPRVPHWVLFLIQFTNLLMVLLIITALLCIILYLVDTSNPVNLYLGVFLLIVVVFTCYETYSQEAKSDSLMEKFRAMVPEKAAVIRDGVMRQLSATDIVIGDLLRLKSGDKVPADCRVIYNQSMKVSRVESCRVEFGVFIVGCLCFVYC